MSYERRDRNTTCSFYTHIYRFVLCFQFPKLEIISLYRICASGKFSRIFTFSFSFFKMYTQTKIILNIQWNTLVPSECEIIETRIALKNGVQKLPIGRFVRVTVTLRNVGSQYSIYLPFALQEIYQCDISSIQVRSNFYL